MPQTILITGASSGIGKATTEFFSARGWNVIATMRSPDKADKSWQNNKKILITALDVTKPETIKAAIQLGIDTFSGIDVLLNNAGFGLTGPLEGMTTEQIKKQMNTNVVGLMTTIQLILPHFRKCQSGCIINISSIGGRVTFPYYSAYHATKWAVEGLSESLRYELATHGIRIKVVEPGPIKTDFYSRSMDNVTHPAYNDQSTQQRNTAGALKNMPGPQAVASVIYQAATDTTNRFRYPAKGALYINLRRFLPLWLWERIIKRVFGV